MNKRQKKKAAMNRIFNMGYPMICPCCLRGLIEEKNGICPVCKWEDDRVQNENPDYAGGANADSLKEHRRKLYKGRI